MYGATIFPHSIGVAATFNVTAAQEAGRVTAMESKRSGMEWVEGIGGGISQQPLWPRMYQTFGEDPFLAAEMVKAKTRGLQGVRDANGMTKEEDKVGAILSHYLGESFPLSGHDLSDSSLSSPSLSRFFLPPFQSAVSANVSAIMLSSSSINSVPIHSSPHLLSSTLRNTLNFTGPCVCLHLLSLDLSLDLSLS